MINYLKKIHLVVLLSLMLFVIYVSANIKSISNSSIGSSSLIVLDDYEVYSLSNELLGKSSDNISVKEPIKIDIYIPDNVSYDAAIGFSSSHQNVRLYQNNTQLYCFTNDSSNSFGHTNGYGYHFINDIYSYKGEHLQLWIDSYYNMELSGLSNIYIGNSLDIFFEMVLFNSISVIVAVLSFVVGCILGIYWLLCRVKQNYGYLMGYLALFSILLSIWCINESPVLVFLLGNPVVCGYISFISLMSLPIPFALFIREFYTLKEHKIWDIILFVNIFIMALQAILQVFNIRDFKDSLIFTHIMIAFTVLAIVFLTLYECTTQGISKKMKLNITCMAINTVAVTLDIIFFYIPSHNSRIYVGNIGFLIYVIIMGFSTIKDTSTLAAKGVKSDIYKELAYTDALTKLNNRTAMNIELEKANSKLDTKTPTIFMFDLNNLKKCNDTLGHEYGDKYISDSASILKEIFAPLGKCYRIGGDEFCAIIYDISASKTDSLLETLINKTKAYNETHDNPFTMEIACGYAKYDKKIDNRNLTETRSRADSRMYENKFNLKKSHDNA